MFDHFTIINANRLEILECSNKMFSTQLSIRSVYLQMLKLSAKYSTVGQIFGAQCSIGKRQLLNSR